MKFLKNNFKLRRKQVYLRIKLEKIYFAIKREKEEITNEK